MVPRHIRFRHWMLCLHRHGPPSLATDAVQACDAVRDATGRIRQCNRLDPPRPACHPSIHDMRVTFPYSGSETWFTPAPRTSTSRQHLAPAPRASTWNVGMRNAISNRNNVCLTCHAAGMRQSTGPLILPSPRAQGGHAHTYRLGLRLHIA